MEEGNNIMAVGKKIVNVYVEWVDLFEKLTDEEAGRLIKHFFRYINDQHPEAPDRITDIAFEPIKKQLQRDLSKWEAIRDRNVLNGQKGGRPQKQNPKNPVGLIGLKNNPKKPVEVEVEVEVEVKKKTPLPPMGEVLPKIQNSIDFSGDINMTEFYPFDEFWSDYDKKVGDKEKLRRKWNKLSLADRRLIKAFIPLYKRSEPNKKYRKNPETFLNNKSWNDELVDHDVHRHPSTTSLKNNIYEQF